MDCFFCICFDWLTPNKPKTLIFHIHITVNSSFLAIIYKYFTFFQICYFWRCKTSDLSNIAWNFLSVTNERACIILSPLQEVQKTNKTLQARQQFKLFFSRKCLSRCCCRLVLSTFWIVFYLLYVTLDQIKGLTVVLMQMCCFVYEEHYFIRNIFCPSSSW